MNWEARLRAPIAFASRQQTRIRDLIRLVANDADDPHKAVEKGFEWEHARALEIGKWSLAGATALLAAVATGILRQPITDNMTATTTEVAKQAASAASTAQLIVIALVGAGVLLAYGAGSLWFAGRIQRNYLLTLVLLAKMIELRPFLKKSESEADKEP